jgi:hypothetical protein
MLLEHFVFRRYFHYNKKLTKDFGETSDYVLHNIARTLILFHIFRSIHLETNLTPWSTSQLHMNVQVICLLSYAFCLTLI